MQSFNLSRNYTPSASPIAAIEKVSYTGQPAHMKRWVPGYGYYLGALPVLSDHDPLLKEKTGYSIAVLKALGQCLQESGSWFPHPADKEFQRSIIAIEDSIPAGEMYYHDGSEIIVAHWGDGFVSPIHGHVGGLHYEEVLRGKFRVHSYRAVDESSRTARSTRTRIVERGPFVGLYEAPDPITPSDPRFMIHNFEAIGETHSLHFLPEHSHDGMGNGYAVEYFEDVHHLTMNDLYPITSNEALGLPIGSVVLVRSSNVPEYGDHYIIITGRPIMKLHGLRPQDHVIQAPHTARLLDLFDEPGEFNKLTLLKLSVQAAKKFHAFHDTEVFVHLTEMVF